MRPVNKGASPYTTIREYSEALPYLEERIGLYCSYCGMPIIHVPEIEHISSKSAGGDLTNWDNLLLGCKYCNSRKKAHVNPGNVDDFLWPDKYNTALAFIYENGIPKVNSTDLGRIDPTGSALAKAQNLFTLVKLDNKPTLHKRDRRFHERNKAYELARESLSDWEKGKENYPDHIDGLKHQIVRTAKATGFFSIWTTVFADEPEMLNALINAFPGTCRIFFDEKGHPKLILS